MGSSAFVVRVLDRSVSYGKFGICCKLENRRTIFGDFILEDFTEEEQNRGDCRKLHAYKTRGASSAVSSSEKAPESIYSFCSLFPNYEFNL